MGGEKKMRKTKRRVLGSLFLLFMMTAAFSVTVFAGDGETVKPDMYATFWSLIPPVVAIGLALITKEVYSSLFIGILVGGIFAADFSFEGTVKHVLDGGSSKY